MKSWFLLIIAIVSEVFALTALKQCDGFKKLWPSLIVILGYGLAFYFLSLTLKSLPIGVVYAVWSGVGIVLISAVGWLYFGQKLDTPAIVGMLFIVVGIVIMNAFSKAIVAH